MPYNTNNPVPSSDLRDFADNQQTLDEVVNSSSKEVTTRTGKKAKTLAGLQADVVAIGKSASQSAQAAASSAAAAAQSAADAANSAAATGYVDAPFPDVWAPLSDDLRLLAGFAPADTITVAGTSYPLPTKSMTFTRSTTATYIDKSGVLKTAAINEPRFETEGLLIEGQSTNQILNSEDPSKWAGTSSTITKSTLASDGTSQAVTMKGVINGTSSIPTIVTSNSVALVAGEALTVSCRAKGNYGYIRIAFSLDGSTAAATLIEATTGVALSPPAGVTVTSQMGSDGYVNVTATITASVGGNYVGVIAAQKLSADSTIPLNTEYYVQMPQAEKNPVATSYIPTGAAAVTRAIENVNIPAERNIGYRLVGDKFNRTLSFELSVERFSPPSATYFDAIRGLNANNDIILRIMDTSLRSYRAGGGPVININAPFASKMYVQTLDTSDRLSLYMDGKTDSSVGGPTTPTTSATNLNFAAHPNVVYHVRNFRIWHRLLTPTQIRGLR